APIREAEEGRPRGRPICVASYSTSRLGARRYDEDGDEDESESGAAARPCQRRSATPFSERAAQRKRPQQRRTAASTGRRRAKAMDALENLENTRGMTKPAMRLLLRGAVANLRSNSTYYSGSSAPAAAVGAATPAAAFFISNSCVRPSQRALYTAMMSPGSGAAGRLRAPKYVILPRGPRGQLQAGDEVELTRIYTHSYESSLQLLPMRSPCSMCSRNHVLKKETQDGRGRLFHEEDIRWPHRRPYRELDRAEHLRPRGHQAGHCLVPVRRRSEKPWRQAPASRPILTCWCAATPATAKSQFLKYCEGIAPRCVYATGQGASSVGLTAYVHKHPVTKEWCLEGGALVLADKGVCLIDEFDKMSDSDRTSIHEAMEQQSISISKGGIVTRCRARCTVIAAANRDRGRYDPSMTFAENVDLTEPILSRFDVLCVVRDQVDPVQDEKLASHMRPSSLPVRGERQQLADSLARRSKILLSPIQAWSRCHRTCLKKYITWTREESVQSVRPPAQRVHGNRLYSITVRHIESVIRLAEAHAKMHLRKYVDDSDVNMAAVRSDAGILHQQRRSTRQWSAAFRRYLVYQRDSGDLLVFLLRQLIHKHAAYSRTSRRARPGQRAAGAAADSDDDATPDDDDAEGPLTVRIAEKELADLARPLGITPIWMDSFRSEIMTANRFRYDADRREIVCQTVTLRGIERIDWWS
uniref:DNA helicase n=1 Tax=Macrostomum lignano TaxID=282301 RepID=A0A1I8FQ42_9PLAT